MDHPRRAARDPLKGAMREARRSRFLRILGWIISLRSGSLLWLRSLRVLPSRD